MVFIYFFRKNLGLVLGIICSLMGEIDSICQKNALKCTTNEHTKLKMVENTKNH